MGALELIYNTFAAHHMVSRIPNPEYDSIKHEHEKLPIFPSKCPKLLNFQLIFLKSNFILGVPKRFGHARFRRWNSAVKRCFGPVQKVLAFPK
jgi:hypothetical protein